MIRDRRLVETGHLGLKVVKNAAFLYQTRVRRIFSLFVNVWFLWPPSDRTPQGKITTYRGQYFHIFPWEFVVDTVWTRMSSFLSLDVTFASLCVPTSCSHHGLDSDIYITVTLNLTNTSMQTNTKSKQKKIWTVCITRSTSRQKKSFTTIYAVRTPSSTLPFNQS